MTDENPSVSVQNPPKRNHRGLVLMGIVVALGFFALIALNMN